MSDLLDKLNRHLDTCLFDYLRIIADCLEDDGQQELALAYRWLAEERKHPLRYGGRWHWRNPSRESLPRLGHCLPEVVLIAMALLPSLIGCTDYERNSIHEAYRLAADAIVLASKSGKGPLAELTSTWPEPLPHAADRAAVRE